LHINKDDPVQVVKLSETQSWNSLRDKSLAGRRGSTSESTFRTLGVSWK
jgi:hypothetical protein